MALFVFLGTSSCFTTLLSATTCDCLICSNLPCSSFSCSNSAIFFSSLCRCSLSSLSRCSRSTFSASAAIRASISICSCFLTSSALVISSNRFCSFFPCSNFANLTSLSCSFCFCTRSSLSRCDCFTFSASAAIRAFMSSCSCFRTSSALAMSSRRFCSALALACSSRARSISILESRSLTRIGFFLFASVGVLDLLNSEESGNGDGLSFGTTFGIFSSSLINLPASSSPLFSLSLLSNARTFLEAADPATTAPAVTSTWTTFLDVVEDVGLLVTGATGTTTVSDVFAPHAAWAGATFMLLVKPKRSSDSIAVARRMDRRSLRTLRVIFDRAVNANCFGERCNGNSPLDDLER
mmetsp:Transcript_20241/g.44014  ORF Transcript_20241/g.44014 Transcript_20241/m.44014 type:complete len:353 (-) Transcript_20241:291-1349(-)